MGGAVPAWRCSRGEANKDDGRERGAARGLAAGEQRARRSVSGRVAKRVIDGERNDTTRCTWTAPGTTERERVAARGTPDRRARDRGWCTGRTCARATRRGALGRAHDR